MIMDKNTTDAFQRENAERVTRQIGRLKARQTNYMGIGAIAGLLLGLTLGYTIMLSLNQTISWIRLGPICMVVGILAGALLGRMRPKDLAAITKDLTPPPAEPIKR